jgi:hypothetical protein
MALICYERAILPIQQGVTSLCRYKWQFGALFDWIHTFWVVLDSPLLTIMECQKAITIFRGLSYPTRSLSRRVCRGQERPKVRKGTLRPDFQANTRPSIFFLSRCHHARDTGRQLWGHPCIVSLRQFRDNVAWIQLGQESPLMNKKGLTVYPPTCPRLADSQPLSSDFCVQDQGCSRGSGGGLGSLQYLASPNLPLAKTNLLIKKFRTRRVNNDIIYLHIIHVLRSILSSVGVCTVHCNETPIYVFLFWELHRLSPNFHIHVSVSDLQFPE